MRVAVAAPDQTDRGQRGVESPLHDFADHAGRGAPGRDRRPRGRGPHRTSVRAVLTGGACAYIYTRGAYESADMDYSGLPVRRGRRRSAATRVRSSTSGSLRRRRNSPRASWAK
jgi:hypothetical protein